MRISDWSSDVCSSDLVTTDVGIVTVPCRLRFAEAVSVRAMWLVWLTLVTRSEVPSCLPSLGEVRALPQFVPACSAVRPGRAPGRRRGVDADRELRLAIRVRPVRRA